MSTWEGGLGAGFNPARSGAVAYSRDYMIKSVRIPILGTPTNLEIERKKAIRAAKELGYEDSVVENLKCAKTVNELTRILHTARMAMN